MIRFETLFFSLLLHCSSDLRFDKILLNLSPQFSLRFFLSISEFIYVNYKNCRSVFCFLQLRGIQCYCDWLKSNLRRITVLERIFIVDWYNPVYFRMYRVLNWNMDQKILFSELSSKTIAKTTKFYFNIWVENLFSTK